MKRKYRLLALVTLFSSINVYAEADFYNPLPRSEAPVVAQNQIQGKSAGGESQTTIVDENGNLKVISGSQTTQTSNAAGSSTTTTTTTTSPGMQQSAPTGSGTGPVIQSVPPQNTVTTVPPSSGSSNVAPAISPAPTRPAPTAEAPIVVPNASGIQATPGSPKPNSMNPPQPSTRGLPNAAGNSATPEPNNPAENKMNNTNQPSGTMSVQPSTAQ